MSSSLLTLRMDLVVTAVDSSMLNVDAPACLVFHLKVNEDGHAPN